LFFTDLPFSQKSQNNKKVNQDQGGGRSAINVMKGISRTK
jgi:hypothetical protein